MEYLLLPRKEKELSRVNRQELYHDQGRPRPAVETVRIMVSSVRKYNLEVSDGWTMHAQVNLLRFGLGWSLLGSYTIGTFYFEIHDVVERRVKVCAGLYEV